MQFHGSSYCSDIRFLSELCTKAQFEFVFSENKYGSQYGATYWEDQMGPQKLLYVEWSASVRSQRAKRRWVNGIAGKASIIMQSIVEISLLTMRVAYLFVQLRGRVSLCWKVPFRSLNWIVPRKFLSIKHSLRPNS